MIFDGNLFAWRQNWFTYWVRAAKRSRPEPRAVWRETSASTQEVTATAPSGTDSISKCYIMILVLHELIFRDTFKQLKLPQWCLSALGGRLLYLPFKLWWTARACAGLRHKGRSPFSTWYLAQWLQSSPRSNKLSSSNVSAWKKSGVICQELKRGVVYVSS